MEIVNPFGKEKVVVQGQLAGRPLTLEVNRLAFRASAAVLATWGETVVLATVVVGQEKTELDYFPLSVDYEERFYAAGKISGSRYVKREGRPSDEAVLVGRLIDRSLRPLFAKDFRAEVQIVTTVLSLDNDCQPDSPAIIGAASALLLAGLPFNGPASGVRVGLDEQGRPLVGLTAQQRLENRLDLIVSSNQQGVVMVEAGSQQVKEAEIIGAIEAADQANTEAIKLQEQLLEKLKPEALEYRPSGPSQEIKQAVADWWQKQATTTEDLNSDDRHRNDQVGQIREKLSQDFKLEENEQARSYQEALESLLNAELRKFIIDKRERIGGRQLSEVRQLSSQVGIFSRTHGSSLFTRGATQALNIVTLAPLSQSQSLDTMTHSEEKRYFHHYNAPGYTVGEAKRLGSPGRREIGHSYLAERAIIPVLPDEKDFPYAIRSVTEIMSQQGSTSMAAACSSCLALMDAGVPLKTAIGGVAMGLILNDKEPVILTDIQDAEDFAGDMDFKVAGSRQGITALQMDMKVPGLPVSVLKEALMTAEAGRLTILDHMSQILAEPRPELSPHAPRVESIMIPPEKIKDVIGKGGETIHHLVEISGAQIDIKDDGQVLIFSNDQAGLELAKKEIQKLTAEPEVGQIYRQRPVVKITDFGLFVNILPGRDGLVHVSEISQKRVQDPADLFKVKDLVDVKLLAIDERGRLNLSIKQI